MPTAEDEDNLLFDVGVGNESIHHKRDVGNGLKRIHGRQWQCAGWDGVEVVEDGLWTEGFIV